MRYPGFCGGTHRGQSVIANSERTINWYPERVEGAAPVDTALYPTPGFVDWLTAGQITELGLRASFEVGGRAFVVVGTGFYEVFATGLATFRGTVAQDNNPATISYNGITGGQLFITSGTNGYLYNLTSHAFTQPLTGDATQGGMINSRFLAFDVTTGIVRMSGLNDGATWDASLYFQRSQAADPWLAMIVRSPEIWLIGEKTYELWSDQGNYPQPFAPIGGALGGWGIPSSFCGTIAGDFVTWVSKNDAGQGVIVAADGYVPKRISTYAIETAIAGYARQSTSSLADAEVLAYQDQGHLWAVFSFPSGMGPSLAVDLQTGDWHERGTFVAGHYGAWAPRVHLYAFNKHLVGGRGSSRISEMDVTFGSEADGSAIRRLRIGPPLYAQARSRLFVDYFQLLAEPGLGVVLGQGVDPVVMLRTSPDAKRWSAERMARAGRMGQFGKTIEWARCGSSEKLWVPEVTVSDPIPWRLSGAEIGGSGFAAPGRAAA